MNEILYNEAQKAIKNLCGSLHEFSDKNIEGIGFVITDDMQNIGAKILFEGDLANDAESYQKLSPVEWISSEEEAFTDLNSFLKAPENIYNEADSFYEEWVSDVFKVFVNALRNLKLRAKYGESLYLTFAGVDPNEILEKEEKLFVKAMNSTAVYEQWREEFD